MIYKLPVSVLVVVHTPELEVLLLERTEPPGFWQSVTGSQEAGETLLETAVREMKEETGLDVAPGALTNWNKQNEFEIFRRWRNRYAPGVTHNTEHVFSLKVAEPVPVTLDPGEHTRYEWLPYRVAAERVFSWSNADALRELPQRAQQAAQKP